jgi:hypothetical protein
MTQITNNLSELLVPKLTAMFKKTKGKLSVSGCCGVVVVMSSSIVYYGLMLYAFAFVYIIPL